MTEWDRSEHDARMIERTLFFSDAVFAIAMTLLVLELRVPEDAGPLLEALAERIPEIVVVVISFALAGGWWLIHQAVMQHLVKFDWATAVLNLLLLLFVMLTPFATGLQAAYPYEPAALAAYWGANAGASLALTLMFAVMSRGGGRLFRRPMTSGARLRIALMSLVPGVCFVLGAMLAAAGQRDLSQLCWIPIPVYFALAAVLFRGRKSSRTESADAPDLAAPPKGELPAG